MPSAASRLALVNAIPIRRLTPVTGAILMRAQARASERVASVRLAGGTRTSMTWVGVAGFGMIWRVGYACHCLQRLAVEGKASRPSPHRLAA